MAMGAGPMEGWMSGEVSLTICDRCEYRRRLQLVEETRQSTDTDIWMMTPVLALNIKSGVLTPIEGFGCYRCVTGRFSCFYYALMKKGWEPGWMLETRSSVCNVCPDVSFGRKFPYNSFPGMVCRGVNLTQVFIYWLDVAGSALVYKTPMTMDDLTKFQPLPFMTSAPRRSRNLYYTAMHNEFTCGTPSRPIPSIHRPGDYYEAMVYFTGVQAHRWISKASAERMISSYDTVETRSLLPYCQALLQTGPVAQWTTGLIELFTYNLSTQCLIRFHAQDQVKLAPGILSGARYVDPLGLTFIYVFMQSYFILITPDKLRLLFSTSLFH